MGTNQTGPIRLFLCGDVMTGRGIDQVLPHPGNPELHEAYVRDAGGIAHPGAGRAAAEAAAPAALDVPGKGRVLVFSLGSTTSGIPRSCAATEDRPGVNLLEDLSEKTARRVAAEMREVRRPGDV